MTIWHKESREVLVTLPIAAAVLGLLCWNGTPDRSTYSSPHDVQAGSGGVMIGSLYALARLSTFRPAPRRRIGRLDGDATVHPL